MIKYRIAGIASTLQSSEENFRRDVNRWLQKHGLSITTEIEILDYDVPSTDGDGNGTGSPVEQQPIPEIPKDLKPPSKRQHNKKTIKLPAVHNTVDFGNLFADDVL